MVEVESCPSPTCEQSAVRVDGLLNDMFSQVFANPDPMARVLMERMSGNNIKENFMILSFTYQ
jgi:hypothetical protein